MNKVASGIFVLFALLAVDGCGSSKVYKESGITNLMQLTTDRSFEVDPAWSSSGNTLYFASDRSGALELWSVPKGGGGIQQLTVNSRSGDRAPDPSPDETEVVFQSTRVTGAWNIWKISLGNRGLVQLSNNPYGSFEPRWSPDGKKIVFTARDKENELYIWTIGSNGQNPTQMGPGSSACWTPDGKKIVFSRKSSGDKPDIWIMNADGTSPTQLTSEKERRQVSPVVSRDGKRIAYTVQYSSKDFFDVDEGKIKEGGDLESEIWMMDSDGKNKTQLTAFKGLNISPAWSSDGSITFVSNRGDSWDIWSMMPLSPSM